MRLQFNMDTSKIIVARSADRQPTLVPAKLRCGGDLINCEVIDLSIAGCRVRTMFPFLRDGYMTLTLPNLAPIGAYCRWRLGNEAGMLFERNIHISVLDNLARRFPDRMTGSVR